METRLVNLEDLVHEAKELEPLPASATRLARLVSTPDWNLEAIAETIRLDEALTGRLLSAANSAWSGARHEITTVEQAVMRLGPGRVLSLAIGASVGRRLHAALPPYGLAEGELWRHSVAAALAVEAMPRYCRRPVSPEAFASALLHDIGKLILARHLDGGAVAELERACVEGGLTYEEAELHILQVSHAELGAAVARHWGLPETIASGIQHHHHHLDGATETARILCLQIALADAAAVAVGAPCGEVRDVGFSPALAGGLGIGQDEFARLCSEVETQLEDVLAAYG